MTCACSDFSNQFLTLAEIADGAAGTRTTLKVMRDLVRAGKRNPILRDAAQNVIRAVPAKNWLGEISAIFAFIRKNIRYSLDAHAIEIVQGPMITLRAAYGDCDDICVLLATLLESIGHPCVLAALGFEEPGNYSHVLVLTSGGGETELISLDATEPQAMGWFPPGVSSIMFCPIESES